MLTEQICNSTNCLSLHAKFLKMQTLHIKDVFIRETNAEDFDDIMMVEERAFGYPKEAMLTASLLGDNTAKPILSLLAIYKGKAIGHVLFTRAYIADYNADQPLMHILAPLAIIPEFQKKGIGGMLIKKALGLLKEMGSEMVFVLGHMKYYPKFGFVPDAGKIGYSAPYPIPDEFANAWMVQTLNEGGFVVDKGKVLCAKELNKPEHWRE